MDFSQSKQDYDVVVIGAGPTGLMAALEAAQHGRKVALLEKREPLDLRNPAQQRFQAVVVDLSTMINLTNVGVDTAGGEFFPLSEAIFPEDKSYKAPAVQYHRAPQRYSGESSGDIWGVAFRRKIVALASIGHIERQLTDLVEAASAISVFYNATLSEINVGLEQVKVTYAYAGKTESLRACALAVADGARSDKNGALQLLGVSKISLSDPINIVTARYRELGREGQLIVREVPDPQHQHTGCFGLKDEAVVYTNISQEDVAKGDKFLQEYMSSIAKKLGLNDEIIGEPVLVPQHAAMVQDEKLSSLVHVLGDAAFSGTAILGLYLNKGICDAVAFGAVLRHESAPKRVRISNPAYAEIIAEENFVASMFNADWRLVRDSLVGRKLFSVIPRCLFRVKVGQHGIPRALAVNTADVISTLYDGAADYIETPILKKSARAAALIWKTFGKTLEGDSKK